MHTCHAAVARWSLRTHMDLLSAQGRVLQMCLEHPGLAEHMKDDYRYMGQGWEASRSFGSTGCKQINKQTNKQIILHTSWSLLRIPGYSQCMLRYLLLGYTLWIDYQTPTDDGKKENKPTPDSVFWTGKIYVWEKEDLLRVRDSNTAPQILRSLTFNKWHAAVAHFELLSSSTP